MAVYTFHSLLPDVISRYGEYFFDGAAIQAGNGRREDRNNRKSVGRVA